MYQFKAIVENVVDGDTLDLLIDLGFKIHTKQRVRLSRVDTPERGQPGYSAARDFVKDVTLNKHVTVSTEKISKWGYYLAEINLEDGKNINDLLIQSQLAKPYDGGKKC